MNRAEAGRPVAVIGAGLDLGAGRRGVDMGPSAIRYAGLQERIASSAASVSTGATSTWPSRGDRRRRPAGALPRADQARCERVAGARRGREREGSLPLVLGGDHSVAIGTLGGMARVHGPGGALWIDAHGDLNRPRPPRAATCTGCRSPPRSAWRGTRSRATPGRRRRSSGLALVGVRSLDAAERELIGELDAEVFTMSEIDRLGVDARCARRSSSCTAPRSCTCSLDLDAVDPMFAPGVGTPVRGGLSYREAHLTLELVAESGLLGLARARRGEPDPRPRERDRSARRRARRERARRTDPLSGRQ